MKRGFNELVGIQVTFDREIPRYRMAHYYRWSHNGEVSETGTLRSFDMLMHVPSDKLLQNFRDAYAPAILSIWRRVTQTQISEYYQFRTKCLPSEMGFVGRWHHWAER